MKSKSKKEDKIVLTLTEEQAKVVSIACEFYMRMRCGQFFNLIEHTLDAKDVDTFCKRRDKAEELLLKVREQLLPELHGIGHSYGIGKFKDADIAYDVHQVIRTVMGDERPPFSYYPLPKCERVKG